MNSHIRELTSRFSQRFFKPSRTLGGTRITNTYARLLASTIIAFSSFSLLWLLLAKTDQIITVQGQLQPAGRTTKVQLPQGGIVKSIRVKEGEHVSKGQLLVELDNDALIARQKSLIKSLEDKKIQLRFKHAEIVSLVRSFNTKKLQLQEALALENDIQNRYKSLSKEGVVPLIQYLQQISKVKNLKLEILKSNQDFMQARSSMLQEIQGYNISMNEFTSQLREAEVLLRNQLIRSPVAGIIFDLKPSTGGFVGQSSEAIMEVVPQDQLIAKVDIPSADIGLVKLNQPVDINIDAFPSTDFGYIEGTLTKISSDSLPPDEQKRFARFPSTITLENNSKFFDKNPGIALKAGMTLKANIKLRRVSYFSLIFTQFDNARKSIQKL